MGINSELVLCTQFKHKEQVLKLLNKCQNLDLTYENGQAIRFAIIHDDQELLSALLKYYEQHQLNMVPDSEQYKVNLFTIKSILENAYDEMEFSDATTEVTAKYLGKSPQHNLLEVINPGRANDIKELIEDAIEYGYLEELLAERSPNAGHSPLIKLIKKDYYNLAELVTEYDEDLDYKDLEGLTALHHAALRYIKGHKTSVNIMLSLIAHDADPYLKDIDGETIFDYEDLPKEIKDQLKKAISATDLSSYSTNSKLLEQETGNQTDVKQNKNDTANDHNYYNLKDYDSLHSLDQALAKIDLDEEKEDNLDLCLVGARDL